MLVSTGLGGSVASSGKDGTITCSAVFLDATQYAQSAEIFQACMLRMLKELDDSKGGYL